MKTVCENCQGTGKLGFQREDCWFCGGVGYIDDLVHKPVKVETYKIKEFKDIKEVRYEGDLDKYFKEANECDISNDVIKILSDMYDLIKK